MREPGVRRVEGTIVHSDGARHIARHGKNASFRLADEPREGRKVVVSIAHWNDVTRHEIAWVIARFTGWASVPEGSLVYGDIDGPVSGSIAVEEPRRGDIGAVVLRVKTHRLSLLRY